MKERTVVLTPEIYSDNLGVQGDIAHAESVPAEKRCTNCDGTGNQFFFMYQRCEVCNGTGKVRQ